MSNEIIRLLNNIEKNLEKLNHSCLSYLDKGISIEDIHLQFSSISLQPNLELIALFSWRNGVKGDEDVNLGCLAFFPGFYLMSLQECISHYNELIKLSNWKKTWFPIFANGGGDFYAINLAEQGKGQIIGFFVYEDEHAVEYNSLKSMLQTINECYEKGIIYIDSNDYLDMDYYEYAHVASSFNPNVTIWIDIMNNG